MTTLTLLTIAIATALTSQTSHVLPSSGGVAITSWEVTTDPAGWFQPTTPACITPQADGIYDVSTRVVLVGSSGGGSFNVAIRKRGALKTETVAQVTLAPRAVDPVHVIVKGKVTASAGECLFVGVASVGGGTVYPRAFGITQEVP